MKKLFLLTKTLLAVALLCVGQNAWGEDKEVTLNCTNSITILGTGIYGTDGSAHSSSIYLNSYAPNGGAGAFSFTLDEDWDASKVKSAVLRFYPISKCNKNRSGSIYIKALASYPTPSTTSTSYSEGKHIVYSYGGSTTKRYSFADAATATISAYGYDSYAPAKGAYYDVDLTSYIQGLSTKSAGDAIYFGIDVSDWAADIKIGAYGDTYAPKLVITYTSETLYTTTFTANSGAITPTVTIYSDAERETPVTNGTLADKTTYYYRAVLEGYNNYEGSFTVDGANPSVSFTMTAKTPVASLTVNYKYGDDIVYTDNQSVTGLYVGESLNVPFRMYVMNGEALYQAAARATNPWYGEPTTLTENTVVEKSVTPVDLGGGKVVLFEDLDNTDAQNAGIRASYCSAYDNRAYTSAEVLPAGTYTFYLKLQNKGRTSKIMIGETEICAASAYAKDSWSNVTLTDVDVPSAGNLTIAAGGSSTRDDYDVIIAVLKSVSATIGSNGFTTFASPYPLDLTSATQKANSFTAYRASAVNDETVTFKDDVNQTVVANTGVLLQGTPDAVVTIPVVVSGSALAENALQVNVAGTTFAAAANTTYYGMNKGSNPLTFGTFDPSSVAIPASKAYLALTSNAARSIRVVFGDITGVANVEADAEAKAKDGKFIENGKLVIVKNGQKFNAAGAQVK